MRKRFKGTKIGKIYNNTISNYDSYDINSRTSYYKYHNKTIQNTEYNREDFDENNNNFYENTNSIHTSYKYRKRKKGNMTISSKDSESYKCNRNNECDSSISISTNENLICPYCINDTLIENKKLENDLSSKKNKINLYQDNINNNSYNYPNLIDKKIHQREQNTNFAMQTLSKLNSSMSNKEKLIKINESYSNPFQGNDKDYQYEKFRKEYEKRQKMINENLDKYFPSTKKKTISETPLFFDKSDEKNKKMNQSRLSKNEYNNRKEYIKSLEDQIREKNEKKRKEKEEDQKREKKYFEEMEQKRIKEEEERIEKEKKQKENFIKINKDIINQKKKEKIKQLEENLKYKEYIDKQNEFYKNELLEKQKENERLLNGIYNSNRKDNENNKKIEDQNDNNKIDINDNDHNNVNYKNDENNRNNNIIDYQNQNKNGKNKCCYNINEQKGECCRCHRILPRRLLTINRYFYKENRMIKHF